MSYEYQCIYFSPHPMTEWKIPWAFIVETELGHRRIPSGLEFNAETTGSNAAAALANCCWKQFETDGNFLSLGPHFTRGALRPIPEKVPHVETWLKGLVKP